MTGRLSGVVRKRSVTRRRSSSIQESVEVPGLLVQTPVAVDVTCKKTPDPWGHFNIIAERLYPIVTIDFETGTWPCSVIIN